jgi:hypothetical protein
LVLHVVTGVGTPNPEARVELTNIPDKKDYSGHFTGHVANGIPYGRYLLRVHTPGYLLERFVDIEQPETWLQLGTQLGRYGNPEQSTDVPFEGTVIGLEGLATPIWVKLVPLFYEEAMQAPVGASGEFAFKQVPLGRYLILVISGSALIHTEEVNPSRLPLIITIGTDDGKAKRAN